MRTVLNDEIAGIKNIVNSIEGWLGIKEGIFLYNLAENCSGKGVIVEIGSWKGKSTIWLGKGSQKGKQIKIYAVDPHLGFIREKKQMETSSTFVEFKRNIEKAGVDYIIVPLIKTSREAAVAFQESIELLFIDGLHEYEFVKKDFSLWSPKVINNGIVVLHDVRTKSGVRRVFRRDMCLSKSYKGFGLCESMGYARKVENRTLLDGLRGIVVWMVTFLYDLGQILNRIRFFKPLIKFAKKIIS